MTRCVALTGATGFIGRHIATSLLAEGLRVRALKRGDAPLEMDPAIEWVTGDLGNAASLSELVRGADSVIHCAGVVRGSSAEAFDAVNVGGTARLARAAREDGGVRRFLLLSSLAAREPGLSWYSASKHGAEEALARGAGDDFTWAVFRPTAVYGPGDREMRPLFLAMRRGILPVLGDRHGRISLLHVEDLVRAVTAWLLRKETVTGLFELHDGVSDAYNWPRIAEIAESVFGRPILTVRVPAPPLFAVARVILTVARIRGTAPMLTPGKVRELRHRDWSCDNEAVTAALAWAPRIDLATALRQGKAFGA